MKQHLILSPARPRPQPDETSAPFFDALSRGRLQVQACAGCGMRQLGRHRCLACGSDGLRWEDASGRGVLYSFAIVRATENPHFNQGKAYNVAIVELAEGPQIYTNIVNAEPHDLRIGMPLRAVVSPLDGGAAAPVFEPLG